MLKHLLQDYWLFLGDKRGKFLFFSFLRSVSQFIPFVNAYLLGRLVDFFTIYQQGNSLLEFYVLIGLITFFGVFFVWLRFLAKKYMYIIGTQMRGDLRVRAMEKLIDLELRWHEKEETGSKMQKINEGSNQVYLGVKFFANQGMTIFVGIFGSLFLFSTLSLKYALYAFFYFFFYILGEHYFNRKLDYWQNHLNAIKEKVSGKFHESAANLLTVKSLGLKGTFTSSTSKYEEKYYHIWLKTLRVRQQKSKVIKSFAAFLYGGFLFMVGFDVLLGVVSVGSIVIYSTYFGRLREGLDTISNYTHEYISIKSGIGRFMRIFGMEIFEREEGLKEISQHWKTIAFESVSFTYNKKEVLNKFSLLIKRGERIGIVGQSGSGKSTLVKLLLGLYHPVSGQITIDGEDLFLYKHSSLTKKISVVLQESEMFNVSLFENVTISNQKKSQKKFERAIEIAQLHSLIAKLPEGAQTLIGERGYQLSGGERQRVGIARAIYKDSDVLLFDEATSSLDSKTERYIQHAIDTKLPGKTLLIVAHRFSTLRNVDRIVVIDKGLIVEQGTFKELLAKKGKFYDLYKLQSSRFS